MPKATSSRRTLIVYALLLLAVIGGAMLAWAPKPSLARDVGSLLLVLWIPVISNVVGFAAQKLRLGPGAPPDFEAGSPFTRHLDVDMEPLQRGAAALAPIAPDETRCALVVGKEAFTARLPVPLVQWLASPGMQALPLELLRPDLALPRLAGGTAFSVLVGTAIVGKGRVLPR
jgi:hypothetical protein